jgi:hypothetical protein
MAREYKEPLLPHPPSTALGGKEGEEGLSSEGLKSHLMGVALKYA